MTLTCTNVTLRQKPLRNDRISLYLDYYPAIRNPYTMKMSRREFLGIYIYAKPKDEQQRMFNQDMLNKAEAIRCIRVQSLINEEFGFLDKNKQKVDFLAYFPYRPQDRPPRPSGPAGTSRHSRQAGSRATPPAASTARRAYRRAAGCGQASFPMWRRP